jgi:hypothetical protein
MESHQPLRLCRPPPELLGQRAVKLKRGSADAGQESRQAGISFLGQRFSESSEASRWVRTVKNQFALVKNSSRLILHQFNFQA